MANRVWSVSALFLFLLSMNMVGFPAFLAAQEAEPPTKKTAGDAKTEGDAEKKERPRVSRAEWFESLRKKYALRLEKLENNLEDAQAKVDALSKEKETVTAEYVEKLLAIIEKKPGDETALQAIQEILQHRFEALTDEQASLLFGQLTEHHAESEQIIELVRLCGELESNKEIDAFLNAVIEKNKNYEARAWALFAMATAKYTAADAANDAAGFAAAEKLFDRVLKAIPADKTEGTPFDASEKFLFELRNLVVGKEAPDFECADLSGKQQKLHTQRGKVVVLDFWATWCGYCVEMIPHEREMLKKFADKPLTIISISSDEDADTVRDFIADHPMPWTHWWNGPSGGVVDAWNIQGFPTIFVLDAKGVIRYRNVRDADLEQAVKTLLAEMETENAKSPAKK